MTAVAAGGSDSGGDHTCAVLSTGALQCWGNNGFGQLGDNTVTNRSLPVAPSGLSSGVAAVATGDAFTCALTTSGGVLCWGHNGNGELGSGNLLTGYTPAAVPGLTGVKALATGQHHTCALTTAGGLLCWGANGFGQLGTGSTAQALSPAAVSGLSSGVAAVSAAADHTCALTTAGGVLCWGRNDKGQLGDGDVMDSLVPVAVSGLSSGVVAVAAGGGSGFGYTCALTSAGGVLCWGDDGDGELGNGSQTGSLVPVAVSGLSSGVTAIAAGFYQTCAVSAGGGASCWGWNQYGQLGNGGKVNSSVPVSVSGLSSGVSGIACGGQHTCAVTGGGASCWGNNDGGPLGNGTTTASLIPIAVVEP